MTGQPEKYPYVRIDPSAGELGKLQLQLVGNLAAFDARAVVLTVTVGSFPAVLLAFAWTQASDAPLLLGQVNFFKEFDVCFYGSTSTFEIRPRSP